MKRNITLRFTRLTASLLILSFVFCKVQAQVAAGHSVREILAAGITGVDLGQNVFAKAEKITTGTGTIGSSCGQHIVNTAIESLDPTNNNYFTGTNMLRYGIQNFGTALYFTKLTSQAPGDIANKTARGRFNNSVGYKITFTRPVDIKDFMILDLDGNISPTGSANSEWVSVFGYSNSSFVPFNGALVFTNPANITNVGTTARNFSRWNNVAPGISNENPEIWQSTFPTGLNNSNSSPNSKKAQLVFNPSGPVTELFILWGSTNPTTDRALGVGPILTGPITPLPLTLVGFTGKAEGANIILSWKSMNEVNTSHFDIQKSSDGKDFSSTGTVSAVGNGNNIYSFRVNNAIEKANNFRLKMVDIDGQTTYSRVIVVNDSKNTDKNLSLVVFPIPVVNDLYINLAYNGPMTITIYNTQGQKAKVEKVVSSVNSANINCSTLPAGMYYLNVLTGDGRTSVTKFLKQ